MNRNCLNVCAGAPCRKAIAYDSLGVECGLVGRRVKFTFPYDPDGKQPASVFPKQCPFKVKGSK